MSSAVARPRAKSRTVVPFPSDLAHEQARIDAMQAQAAALNRLADVGEKLAGSVDKAIEAFRPAADAVHGLGEAQRKLCAFLVKHRLKLVASIPAVLVGVGAISPNAAHGLATLLKGFGAP